VTTRLAVEADVPVIIGLIRALADYEKEPPSSVQLTEELLHDALFGSDPSIGCHVVDVDGTVVGFACWHRTYSTWTGVPGLWLEDLFVLPSVRGCGHGKALLAALAQHVVSRGWKRVEWAVLDWNTPAQGFYRSLGAGPVEGWERYRLDGDALSLLGS
jgi:GNAT superfamily N-acetyltransferase